MASNIIEFDIGGKYFKTTRTTINTYDTMLRRMLNGGLPIQLENKRIFIDRSGKHFDSILNFMRDGYVPLPNDRNSVDEILHEAKFYCFKELEEYCVNSIAEAYDNVDHRKDILYVSSKQEKEKLVKQYKIVVCLVMNPIWIPDLNERAKYIVQKRYLTSYKEKHPDILFIIDGTGERLLCEFEKLRCQCYYEKDISLHKINLEIYVIGQIYRRTDEFHTSTDQHSLDNLENWIHEVKKSVIPLLPDKYC